MKESITEVKNYSDTCPICGKELIGWSESQVRWIMKLHMASKVHNKKGDIVK